MAFYNGIQIPGLGANITLAPIDETYNPESENAQSGKAVAEAVSGKADREEWEFINELTLTEDAAVSFTDISLKKFKVLVELPQMSERVILWLKLNNILAMFTEQSAANATNPSFDIEGNYTYDWQFIATLDNSNAYNLGTMYSTPYGHRYSGENIPYPCTKIELALNAGMSTALPTGTKIRLWGVRA